MTLNVDRLVRIQDEATIAWHRREAVSAARNPLEAIVLEQHRANYDLWHQEDGARDPEAADATIADVKHAIDRINQRRNDLVEQMDALLLEAAGPQVEDAPLHSETPGMIVDRLSILELKVYHTALEVHRETATDAHRARNAARLAVLEGQRADLAACLDTLWSDVLAGRRRVKLYRQMKMYNDPELNPVLYGKHSR